MKKLISLTVALILSATCMTGCGSSDNKSGATEEYEVTFDLGDAIVTYNGVDSVVTVPSYPTVYLTCRKPEQINKIVLTDGIEEFYIKNQEEYINLSEYEVDKKSSKFTTFDGVVYYKFSSGNRQLDMIPPAKTEFAVPDDLTVVNIWAFDYWQGTEFTIPESVTKIEYERRGYTGHEMEKIHLDHEITINIPEHILNTDYDYEKEFINKMIKQDNIILKCNNEIVDTPLEIVTATEPTTEATTTTTKKNTKNNISLDDAWEAFLDMPVTPSSYKTFRTVLPRAFESYTHTIRMGDKSINKNEDESQYIITISGDYYYAPEVVDYTTPTYGTIKFVFSIELHQWQLYESSSIYGSIYSFAVR